MTGTIIAALAVLATESYAQKGGGGTTTFYSPSGRVTGTAMGQTGYEFSK